MRHFPTQRQRNGRARLPWLTIASLLAFGCAKGTPIDPNEIVILTSLPGDGTDAGLADAAADAEGRAPMSNARITLPATPAAGEAAPSSAAAASSSPASTALTPSAAMPAAPKDAGAASKNDAGAGSSSDAGG